MRWLVLLLLLLGSASAEETSGVNQSRFKNGGVSGINMTQVIVDENAVPVKDQYLQEPDDPKCLKCQPLTLGAAIAHALFAALPSEKDVSGEQKFARGELALRIKNNPDAKLTAAEVTVIKDLVGKLYNGVIITRIYPMIDPNAGPPAVAFTPPK